jgi:hypothetical protein
MRSKNIFVSLDNAASILDESTRTVKRYVAAGYLDAGTLPGGAMRLSRAQVLGCVKPLPKKES